MAFEDAPIPAANRFTILNAVLYTRANDLVELVNSESRVMLLYCTREEAIHILNNARELKITGENYVWVAAQSVIATGTPPTQFPVGMLGESSRTLGDSGSACNKGLSSFRPP